MPALSPGHHCACWRSPGLHVSRVPPVWTACPLERAQYRGWGPLRHTPSPLSEILKMPEGASEYMKAKGSRPTGGLVRDQINCNRSTHAMLKHTPVHLNLRFTGMGARSEVCMLLKHGGRLAGSEAKEASSFLEKLSRPLETRRTRGERSLTGEGPAWLNAK